MWERLQLQAAIFVKLLVGKRQNNLCQITSVLRVICQTHEELLLGARVSWETYSLSSL